MVGCALDTYFEYDPLVNINSMANCITLIEPGCTDVNAFNYDQSANDDDGSCIPIITGCLDDNYIEYIDTLNANTPILDENGVNQLCQTLIVYGCTDNNYMEYWEYLPESFSLNNLDPIPNTDDGSCSEPVQLVVLILLT